MSDNATQGTPAPEAPATPAPAAAPETPAAPAPEPGTLTLTSAQLAERLERARKSLLSELGVDTQESAKAAVAAHKAAQEAAKSDLQKATEKAARVEALEAEKASLLGVITARAGIELSGLTEQQRAAVKAIAGEDAAKQLSAIDALRPTWLSAPKPAPLPAPATTVPTAPAPAPATPGSPTDYFAIYQAETNPVRKAAIMAAYLAPQIAQQPSLAERLYK